MVTIQSTKHSMFLLGQLDLQLGFVPGSFIQIFCYGFYANGEADSGYSGVGGWWMVVLHT